MQIPLRLIFSFLLFMLVSSYIQGQEETTSEQEETSSGQDIIPSFLDYSQEPVEYEIGGVEVEGAGSRDKNAIKSIAKLREGKKITIPSETFALGLKGLYRLGLFKNVEILQDSIVGNVVFLKIKLYESPAMSTYTFTGVKKSKYTDLSEIVDGIITRGSIITINKKELAKTKLEEHYIEKGFLDAEVTIKEIEDASRPNAVRLEINVDRKDRVKIEEIEFIGNDFVPRKKLKKLMKGTKKKGTFLKKSKFIANDFKEDKKNVIAHYNKLGFRDATIVKDSIWRTEEGLLNMTLNIEEGQQYFYRNIVWKGNTIYADEQLSTVLGINKGEVYNEELLQKRLSFSQDDGRDISSLYLDQGYLFFDIQPVEVAIFKDSIDIEMRISEGAQASIDNVEIRGNDRTNEHVIRRELRTKPGEKFSRSDIIRSQRQLINLGYFNPESLDIQTPVNPQRGTVDIIYTVEETPSDQLELSAGYGGFSGLIGTLGVTFNNFSIQNIKDKSTWNPLPQGDGQRVSVRLQSNSRFFRSYNASFTEPWLGGEKPRSFTLGVASSTFDQTTFNSGRLDITRFFVGLGAQVKWPDDFFVSNTVLNIETIRLQDFEAGIGVNDGSFRNFNINQTISRRSVDNQLYPRRGSGVSLSVQLTPPYSLFRDDDFFILSAEERRERIFQENLGRGVRNQLTDGGPNDPNSEISFIKSIEDSKRFDLLEYHKWRFDTEWYFNFTDKLVMAATSKMGFLGSYNKTLGIVPFERFIYGGDGLSNQNTGITGATIISSRGYDTNDFVEGNGASVSNNNFSLGGGTIFNKFTVELRYPLSLNPTSTIYVLGFVQGGNVWNDFRNYNPFDLQRAVGGGVRVFLPMFGLLGFDYGYGLDKNPNSPNFGGFGQFNIVLGFEPD